MGRKRGFTLIELFLTLGLITIVGSALVFKAKPMLDTYRYRSAIEKLKQEITFSKKISSISQADIEIEIVNTKKGLAMIRRCDEPLNLSNTFNKWIHIHGVHLVEEEKVWALITGSGAFLGKEKFTISNGNSKSEIEVVEGGVKKG